MAELECAAAGQPDCRPVRHSAEKEMYKGAFCLCVTCLQYHLLFAFCHAPTFCAGPTPLQLEGLELRRVQGVGPEVVDDVLCKLTALTALQVNMKLQ